MNEKQYECSVQYDEQWSPHEQLITMCYASGIFPSAQMLCSHPGVYCLVYINVVKISVITSYLKYRLPGQLLNRSQSMLIRGKSICTSTLFHLNIFYKIDFFHNAHILGPRTIFVSISSKMTMGTYLKMLISQLQNKISTTRKHHQGAEI